MAGARRGPGGSSRGSGAARRKPPPQLHHGLDVLRLHRAHLHEAQAHVHVVRGQTQPQPRAIAVDIVQRQALAEGRLGVVEAPQTAKGLAFPATPFSANSRNFRESKENSCQTRLAS